MQLLHIIFYMTICRTQRIMIPKKDFTGLLYHINILDRVKDKPLIIPEEEKEKQIITLKKELSKKLKLLK